MKDIVLFAMRAEAPNLFANYRNVFCVGTGKVNSAINTMELIAKLRAANRDNVQRVINLGTAGSVTLATGIYRVNRLVQHDVNLMPVGLKPGHVFYDTLNEMTLPGEGVTCGTGDLFVTEAHKLRVPVDCVEMEAYSIAKACKKYFIDCEIYKYISDKADENANTVWQDQIAAGESLYMQVLQDLRVTLEER